MKKLLLIPIAVILALPLKAENKNGNSNEEAKINVGMKVGFNSSMYFTSCLKLDGQRFDDIQSTYKVGYFAALFFRFHMNRHFIQPEFTYNVYKGDIAFNKNQNDATLLPDFAKLNSTIHSLEVPILYGYSFVKKRPYGMALFIGPKLEYIWKYKSDVDFTNFGHTNIEETLRPLNLSAIIGLGVNISNIFFDFRYEIGLNNISQSITYEENANGTISRERGIIFDRHRNVLSFSLGVIF